VKYRRDISSTLTWLAGALILFVGYQVWLKPAFQTSPQIAPEPAVSLSSLPPPALFEGQIFSAWDVPPSRLVELGSAPQLTLGSIRDNLDRGRYKEVDQHLKMLSRNSITNATTRRYIAGLWNNLGVQQEKFGGTALSVSAFKQAVGWDPKSPQAYLNLTQAYWERRDPAMTPQFLNTVIRLAPQDPFPHLALADLLLSEGNITLAKEHLDQARTRAERDPNHASYLQRLTAKIGAAEPRLEKKSWRLP
jgi:tetratricopeptide (TPR) repeat protein